MDKQRLMQIVKKAWGAYSDTQLQLSSEVMTVAAAEQLSWCVCAGIDPGHKSLLLGIAPETAQQLAASMFDIPSQNTDDSTIEDAVTEMVNIISGNVITDFDTGQLAIPVRVDSSVFKQHCHELPIECDLLLSASDNPFYVAIIEENPISALK